MSDFLFDDFDKTYGRKKKRLGHKLTDLDIEEVSLVSRAANRRSFFLKKQAAPEMDDTGDAPDEAGLDAKVAEFMQGAKADALPNLADALDKLNEYRADLPTVILAAIQALLQSMEVSEEDEEAEPDAGTLGNKIRRQLGAQKQIIKSTETFPFPSLRGLAVNLIAGVNPDLAATMISNGRAEERRIAKSMGTDMDDDLEAQVDRLSRENDRLRRTRGISKSIRGQEHISESELGEEEVPFPSLIGMFKR